MRRRTARGHSIAEYAIVFSVVAAAVIGMQIFVKRGLQAKSANAVRALTDTAGAIQDGGTIGTLSQYEPYYADSNYTVTQDSAATDTVGRGSTVTRDVTREQTTRTGSSTTRTDVSADAQWGPK